MPKTINQIKALLENHVGGEMTVEAHLGRKKVDRQRGLLKETFPAVFVVELTNSNSAVKRVSYSYTDILTHEIDVAFA